MEIYWLQKSVRILRPEANLQNAVMGTQRRRYGA